MMALRVKDFARGNAGVRAETVAAWIRLLNGGTIPVVPEKGSVGASGDLVPLAHVGLVLIGEGEAFFDGRRISGQEALAICGLKPLKLEAGEGLAMINGTQAMTAIGGLAVFDAARLARHTDLAAAMSLEALRANMKPYDPRLHELRGFRGAVRSAAAIRQCIDGSDLATGKIAGAVGNYGNLPPAVEAQALGALGLRPETVATQVVARDRHAELFNTLALMGAAMERIAITVRHWQRTEVREAQEAFGHIEVEEILVRPYKAVPGRLRPMDRMVAHTGYLIFARKVSREVSQGDYWLDRKRRKYEESQQAEEG